MLTEQGWRSWQGSLRTNNAKPCPREFRGGPLEPNMAAISPANPIALLRLPTVRDRTGLSRSSIYQRVRDGVFPPPVQIGARAVAWASTDIDRWISELFR